MKKKLALIPLILFFVFFLAACQSEVFLMRSEEDGSATYALTLRLSAQEEQLLNDSAAQAGVRRTAWQGSEGQPWQAVDYFSRLATLTGFSVDASPAQANGARYIVFTRTLPVSGGTGGSGDSATDSTLTRINRFNPFIVRYRHVSPNPFNSYRDSFDAPSIGSMFHIFRQGLTLTTHVRSDEERFPLGVTSINEWAAQNHWQVDTMQGVNGVEAVEGATRHFFYRDEIPSVSEAFPFAGTPMFNPDHLRVNFVLRTRSRYTLSGEDSSYLDTATRYRYHTFRARFDGSDANQIVFTFIRPNPIGWYVLALVLGGATVATLVLILRKRKKKAKISGIEAAYIKGDTFGVGHSNLFGSDDDIGRLN